MASPSTVTVTGVCGPAKALTAQLFTDVRSFAIATDAEMLTIVTGSRVLDVSIAAATTITVTVDGSNYTVTIA